MTPAKKMVLKNPHGGGGGKNQKGGRGAKKCYQPLGQRQQGKNIGATTRIGREIQCLPYVGFFVLCFTGSKQKCNFFLMF